MESTNAQAPEPTGRAVLHGLASSPMPKPSPSSASPSLMATPGCPSDMGPSIPTPLYDQQVLPPTN